ncbi:MAG: type II toxin-antitoxin system RelE/ParE family toxin [Methanoregula sp.]|jgi:mRNA interferase RelE/StbE|uniref:type II toxin-antitoxin system RelE family toxin n=1 Tax=Methanoregula sp. TaxID=2052170 RepID=UPI0025FB4A6C|nr:type II toxin-antitoxin system RelE/ParE family toxin [Methanoregula sp.]MCK9632461.1 type II toxin-antitoxin system RelE/ParE family toxin [Methanoregula sp.]
MSPYRVKYTHRADRDLEKLPLEIARKVVGSIHTIREDPYRFIKKIKASNPNHPIYSLRVRRDVRALLSIHDDVLIIHVLEIDYRKQAYRDF